MSLIVDDPVKTYPTVDAAWQHFEHTFDATDGLVYYEPVFRDYFYEALSEFRQDNVQYLEFRGLLPAVSIVQARDIFLRTEILCKSIKKQSKKHFCGIGKCQFFHDSKDRILNINSLND